MTKSNYIMFPSPHLMQDSNSLLAGYRGLVPNASPTYPLAANVSHAARAAECVTNFWYVSRGFLNPWISAWACCLWASSQYSIHNALETISYQVSRIPGSRPFHTTQFGPCSYAALCHSSLSPTRTSTSPVGSSISSGVCLVMSA